MSERIRLVSGACPFPNEIVSLSIRMKTMPTKMVASSESIAHGLMCSTLTHQLADRARGWREEYSGWPPEKVAEHDPNQDGDHEGETGNVVRGVAEVIGNRLVVGEEGPGLEGQEQEDRADGGGNQEGDEVAPVEEPRGELSPSSRPGIPSLSPPPSCRSPGGARSPASTCWPGRSAPGPPRSHARSADFPHNKSRCS